MRMYSMIRKLQAFFCLLLVSVSTSSAWAMAVDWGGTFRFEYTDVDKPALSSGTSKKSYILNHLNLTPKIIATDGLNVVANIEVLPNSLYPDSQLGAWFGSGTGTVNSNSAVVNTNQNSSQIYVNQLYLQATQEYGALLAGRAPLHFGLGMTQNSGSGLFDHWNQTRDLIGYKFMIGNFFFMPIIGKAYDASLAAGGDVTDQIWHLEYDNPESESAIGFFYQRRSSGVSSNDTAAAFGGTNLYGYHVASSNVFLARGFEGFKFKMEVGFDAGSTGLVDAAGDDIKLSSYGLLFDLDFPRPESRWNWNVRLGLASGDRPSTATYEGYSFSKNYDLALLMFNHPMGQFDILRNQAYRYRTACNGTASPCPGYSVSQAADEDTISNSYFIAPRLSYKWNDRWDWVNSFLWAQLQTNPLTSQNDPGTALGFEWDTGVVYRPHEKVRWKTDLAFFFPGAAWKGGSNNFDNSFNLGMRSALAVSF